MAKIIQILFIHLFIYHIICAEKLQKLQNNTESDFEKLLFEDDVKKLLGIGNELTNIHKRHILGKAAAGFLLEIYAETVETREEKLFIKKHLNKDMRLKRAISNYIGIPHNHKNFQNCNNIITFSSKKSNYDKQDDIISFNLNGVPKDLLLAHGSLRIYKDLNSYQDKQNIGELIVTIYQLLYNPDKNEMDFQLYTSINTTSNYNGWLEFNITQIMSKWLQHKISNNKSLIKELKIGATINSKVADIHDIGLITMNSNMQPFIIGYFDGIELVAKLQTIRFKRQHKTRTELNKRDQPVFKHVRACDRHNFTINFKDLRMHNWIIAPQKFDAYYCGGDCNFPLSPKMNATNHAIVQTLMNLKYGNLPKPCCIPTQYSAISILHYVNEDSVNLSKYVDSVARTCGCH